MSNPPGSLRQTPMFRNCSVCKMRFSAPLVTFQDACRPTMHVAFKIPYLMRLRYTIYAGNKQKTSVVTKIPATQDKTMAVRLTTIQIT